MGVEMRFSVIVPAYNAEDYLEECLLSITNQKYKDFELIIVNDGSDDRTAELCENYSKQHCGVTVLHKKNEGLLCARRDGLQLAKGDYIVFVDSDDTIRSDTLEVCSEVISKYHPDVIQYMSSYNSSYLHPYKTHDLLPKYLYEGKEYEKVLLEACFGGLNSTSFRAVSRTCLVNVLPYDKYKGLMHGEDILHTFYTLDKAKSFYFIPEAFYYYRRNQGASTSSYKPSQLYDITAVMNSAKEITNKWGRRFRLALSKSVIIQYCYLLNIFFNSQFDHYDSKVFFAEIGNVLRDSRVSDDLDVASVRFDNAYIVKQTEKGNYYRAAFLSRFLEKCRRIVRRVRE